MPVRWFASALFFAVVLLPLTYHERWEPVGSDEPYATDADRPPSVGIAVTLYFPLRDVSGVLAHSCEVVWAGDLSSNVRSLIAASASPPDARTVPVFGSGILPNHVFMDARGTLYVDFPSGPGTDSAVEEDLLSLGALLRTLADNLGEARRLKILLGGREAEAFWPHVYTREAFVLPQPSASE